jgi:hypothetical protein
MNIWNKVFIGSIFVLLVTVLVLVSVEMRIRGSGLKTEVSLQKKIEQTEQDIVRIQTGGAPSKPASEKDVSELGFEELRSRLTVQLAQRGRSWSNCVIAETDNAMSQRTLPPTKVDEADSKSAVPLKQIEVLLVITEPQTGEGKTAVAVPEALKGIVYVFRQNQTGDGISGFLGRFTVTSEPVPTKYHDDQGNEHEAYQVAMITADPINDAEIKAIEDASDSRWTLMLSPPKDVIETEPEKRRDYAVALDYGFRERVKLDTEQSVLDSSIETYKVAAAKSQEENVRMNQDIELENKRVAAMQNNRDAVKKTLDEYDAKIKDMTLQSEKLQILQSAYLAKIAEYQLQVKKKIEQTAAQGSK